ncbi:lef-10 [Leucania separata nucleopolyhedrovirus]|uniref:Lef-10 n=1 Tax=Leucania separata nucleopolyhedrovirus TaxID=1307956 RepID=Q0IL56_NPVLS|nr:lef-10 [Leucania separata nucleopolyhedrovirus]AAR28827.1 lef-10 [Leucania separata nucleopolyhedrovirus]
MRARSNMSSPFEPEDVTSVILKNNLQLLDNTYIILHVVDDDRKVQTMCIGEIGFVQTDHVPEESVSSSSVTSELSSDPGP